MPIVTCALYSLNGRDFCVLYSTSSLPLDKSRSNLITHSSDVLKVGHHGSAYGSSPSFIAAVSPRYAIISVGRHNLFGHPAPSTLQTLQRFGARVYRTDEDGAVTIVTDGRSEGISSMLSDESR
jgi:competence protein ComEC